MDNNNLTAFDIGIIEGFGTYIKHSNEEVLINLYEDSFTTLDPLFDVVEYIKPFLILTNFTTKQYKLSVSSSEYLALRDSILTDTLNDLDHLKFIMGFINSNAELTISDKISLTFANYEAMSLVTNKIKPWYIQYNEESCTYTVIYQYPEALDLLNCLSISNGSHGIIRKDIQQVRFKLNTNQFFNPLSSSIQFVKLDPRAVTPSKVRASDTGFDLTLISEVKTFGDVTLYGTGIAISPPAGFYFDLVPRSSISKTGLMLANNVGIIDSTYRGEIMVPLRIFGSEKPSLPAKLVQLIPRRLYHFDVIEAESLTATVRDSGGFGSTG